MGCLFNTDLITLQIYHIIILFVLFGAMILYFKIAEKYNIIDDSNNRSLYDYPAVRGGGIIFWLAGILVSLMYLPQSIFFIIGFTLICGISFRDDISSLSTGIRLMIQFVSVALLFFGLDIYAELSWWMLIIAFICCVGAVNAHNFMDGINGITGLYSLVVLSSLQYVNQNVTAFTQPDFIIYGILACVVFLFFNGRKHAKCFAGDVGSIGIAFWIITLLLQLMLKTNNIIWILFLAVYGVDTACTIIHRIVLKQNILKPHKLHFYQIWVEKTKSSHLLVALIYAVTQLTICITTIYFKDKISETTLGFTLLGILVVIYTLKFQHDFNGIEKNH